MGPIDDANRFHVKGWQFYIFILRNRHVYFVIVIVIYYIIIWQCLGMINRNAHNGPIFKSASNGPIFKNVCFYFQLKLLGHVIRTNAVAAILISVMVRPNWRRDGSFCQLLQPYPPAHGSLYLFWCYRTKWNSPPWLKEWNEILIIILVCVQPHTFSLTIS